MSLQSLGQQLESAVVGLPLIQLNNFGVQKVDASIVTLPLYMLASRLTVVDYIKSKNMNISLEISMLLFEQANLPASRRGTSYSDFQASRSSVTGH